ncbi:hypothetical protein RhiirC2_789593 [Rhizophagus irregularis]|uniref:Uncharacterized protein n=1 Tax=Rhizophagus irregularis TaxID=588596 RepID=A0A2N1MMU2_9GLOM|nr:hypothetical protein RhiirC2_789593 [Rhizophagus irregularis]
MFDSRLTPREIKEKFSWQACKKLANDVEGNGGTIIKDNIEKYGDCFGKIIRINKRTHKTTLTSNTNNNNFSEDEQFRDAPDSLTGSTVQKEDQVEEFNKFNEAFSERITYINGKTIGSTGKGKEKGGYCSR